MSEMQVESAPVPEAATAKRPRRAPVAEAVAPVEVVAELPGAVPVPAADQAVPVAPPPELAQQADPPPASTRRGTREPSGPVLAPFDSALPGVSSADIRAELARRQRRVPKLMAERAMVIQQLDAIEEALESIGEDVPEVETVAAPPEAKGARARNAISLKDAVATAVAPGTTVSPAEVTEAVRKEGYTSTAANLAQMVASTLATDERFERVGRGRYRRLS